MKAIQVHKYVNDASTFSTMGESEGDEYLSLEENITKPGTVLKKTQMLVQVFACSVAPGDLLVTIQGNMVVMKQKCPFVPGMDICGKVVDSNCSTLFKNGDIIVASDSMNPVGGLAEFMVVEEKECAKKPSNVSILEAASCSSAQTSRNAVMDFVKKGDRVLILGGSGGVGSSAIQIAKNKAGASFVATTSTQTEMCKRLGADHVIDYRSQDWWTIPQFQQQKFDVIIDTVGGGNFYGRANHVLKTGKQGGTFVAVTGDVRLPDLSTIWKLFRFFGKLIKQMISTSFTKHKMPKHVTLFPYDEAKGRQDALTWMQEGTLNIKLDDESPFPFTGKGVREAFSKVASGHAHGKIVIEVAKE